MLVSWCLRFCLCVYVSWIVKDLVPFIGAFTDLTFLSFIQFEECELVFSLYFFTISAILFLRFPVTEAILYIIRHLIPLPKTVNAQNDLINVNYLTDDTNKLLRINRKWSRHFFSTLSKLRYIIWTYQTSQSLVRKMEMFQVLNSNTFSIKKYCCCILIF